MALSIVGAAAENAAETQHWEIASQLIVPVMFGRVQVSKGCGPCACHAAEFPFP